MILPRRHGDTEIDPAGFLSAEPFVVSQWQIIRSPSLSRWFSGVQIYAASLIGAFNIGGGSARKVLRGQSSVLKEGFRLRRKLPPRRRSAETLTAVHYVLQT